ncbi:alpha/beta fold hydrolase [Deinococcus sp.]|uniref:alpha/beta fold hydrolase n=1 Tax=Deinococcus sp. TaxID=47478 RepID=UPI003CC5C04B
METHTVQTGPYQTFLTTEGPLNADGTGEALLFIHGSGAGATGMSNWRLALPALSDRFRVLVPDLIGYGQSSHPDAPPQGVRAWMRLWVDQVLSLLDAQNIAKVHLVGNSLGGAICLHLLMEAPERFGKVVLMGSVGAPFAITPELERLWGFYDDPSLSSMGNIIRWFTYDESFIAPQLDQIARTRFEAAMQPQVARSFAAMWPRPRQQHVDALVLPDAMLRRLPHRTLLLHGLQDSFVPYSTSLHLAQHLPDARVHLLGRCSHWIQIEYAEEFHRLVGDFLGS